MLTRRETTRILELIENSPPRNKAFLEAQARYRETKNSATVFLKIGTEEDFFAHGRQVAQLADAGKPIPKQTIVWFEGENEK